MNTQNKLRFPSISSFTSLFCILSASVVVSTQANAIIIGTSTDNLDGTWTYEYVIDNTSGSFDIDAFALQFDFDPDDVVGFNPLDTFSGGDVNVPNLDWVSDPNFSGNNTLDFTDLDALLFGGFGVVAGDSLSGFSFTLAMAPTMVTWTAFDTIVTGSSISGSTVGPGSASVPDSASTGLLLVFSFISLFSLTVRRR